MNEVVARDDAQSDYAQDCALDSLFPEGQIRLAEISVYNWGTFRERMVHTAAIDPGGTLVTGHTGAGKTTFVDAHQVLLSPAGSTYFNVAAAQSDRRDRSLLTYVRGKWASSEDSNGRDVAKFKRPKEALSGVRALYRTDTGREYALAALFWVSATDSAVSHVKRLYVVAQCNLQLKDLLNGLRGGERGSPKPSNLIATYAGDPRVRIVDSFDAYSVIYQDLLCIENDKAPALLSRAMGLKRIEDLTELVRTLVLEEPTTREKAVAAISEFDNLNAIHAAVDEAQRRKVALDRFPGFLDSFRKELESKHLLNRQIVALPVWYARQRVSLLTELLNTLLLSHQALHGDLNDAELSIQRAVDAKEDARRVFEAAGGNQLQNLRERLKLADDQEASAIRERQHAQALLEKASFWPDESPWNELAFTEIKKQIAEMISRAENQAASVEREYADALLAAQKREDELAELMTEVRAMEAKPDSLIPGRYQTMRAELCQELGVTSDQMPFMGELIAVPDAHGKWQGAIERVLGFQRLRLLVEPELGKQVTKLINGRHMNLRVGVEFVRPDVRMTEFRPKSFLRKLEWKAHPFRDWLKRYLSDSTLDCVDTVEEMRATPFSMTITGLVHRKEGSFEKNDERRIDDVRDWFLGFSNEAKKKRLAETVRQVSEAIAAAQENVRQAKTKQGELESQVVYGGRLVAVTWDSIDVEGRHGQVVALRVAIKELEDDGVDLKRAEDELKRCVAVEEHARKQRDIAKDRIVLNEAAQRDREKQRSTQVGRAATLIDEAVIPNLVMRFKTLSGERMELEIQSGHNEVEHAAEQALRQDLEEVRDKLSLIEKTSSNLMVSYRKDFKAVAAELPERGSRAGEEGLIEVLFEWVRHYNELVSDKLPDLVERFQNSLNKQATQSLTVIFQAINSQREEIEDRIESINRVLKGTEFRPGTHLELSPIKLHQEAVTQFDEQLKTVLRLAASGRSDEHFAALKTIIATLQRATDQNTRSNKDSLSQLDARYRMDFAAKVIDRASGEPVDYLRNTGGKSGGEKESFSGSIVAAALAYVLTPAGGRRPSYCTVFLDEAFANTSDVVAKRVLTVFQKLGLHLNLITPFKNVQLVRHVVKSAVVVSADAEMNSELAEVTWEEIDRQRARHDEMLLAQARRLGVETEEVVAE